MLIDGGDGSLYWATSYHPAAGTARRWKSTTPSIFGMRKAVIDYGPRYTGGEEYLDLHG
jgi:hypothetical protein